MGLRAFSLNLNGVICYLPKKKKLNYILENEVNDNLPGFLGQPACIT